MVTTVWCSAESSSNTAAPASCRRRAWSCRHAKARKVVW